MLVMLASIAGIIQTLTPLIPTVIGVGETVAQLFALGNQVAASGADPTHDQWASLVAMQSAALASINASANSNVAATVATVPAEPVAAIA